MPKYTHLALHLGTRKDEAPYKYEYLSLLQVLTGPMEVSLVKKNGEYGPMVSLEIMSLTKLTPKGKPTSIEMTAIISHRKGEKTKGYGVGQFTFYFDPEKHKPWIKIPIPPAMLS